MSIKPSAPNRHTTESGNLDPWVNLITAPELRRRIAALDADVAGAEAKAARLTVSITTRRQTLARLRAQLEEIECGAVHAFDEKH